MVIPEVRQERLYQKIANLIIKLINDNIFPPGTFLPPERELAKQLGVSRGSPYCTGDLRMDRDSVR